MCGIVGYAGNFARIQLAEAVQSLRHRGPDDQGIFVEDRPSIGLGHVRLSILDLSEAAHQPMMSNDGRYVLIYNGEIYNYRALRAELEATNTVSFASQSDTEVLLRLYELEGEKMLTRLNGMFAFAIYDRVEGSIFLARDSFGIKPLYYLETEKGVLFSSEIKAFLAFQIPPLSVDLEAVQQYLAFLWTPGRRTLATQIRKLCPGEALQISNGCIQKRWQWAESPQGRVPIKSCSRPQAIAAVRDALAASVERQLVSDVPVGAFLSGGLDSSALVAFAARHKPSMECFTIKPMGGADAGDVNDYPYALKVAKHLNVNLNVVDVNPSDIPKALEDLVVQLDEPLADPAALNVRFISELARKAGIKVLLSGAGGDDIFSGYRRHLALRFEPLWAWLPASIRHQLDDITSSLNQQHPIIRRISKLFAGAGDDSDRRLVNYFTWIRRPGLTDLYSAEVRNVLQEVSEYDPMLEYLYELGSRRSRIERMLALEQRFFLADHNLTYTDKMSMATGVEVRVPFLDPDLVSITASLSDSFKQRGVQGKWILKKAMEPYLPREVIYRRKSGFGVPLRRWMRHELRDLLSDLLSEDSLRRRGLFSSTAVQQLISDNDTGKVDASYTLLSLVCIEIWCRHFLDGSGIGKERGRT